MSNQPQFKTLIVEYPIFSRLRAQLKTFYKSRAMHRTYIPSFFTAFRTLLFIIYTIYKEVV